MHRITRPSARKSGNSSTRASSTEIIGGKLKAASGPVTHSAWRFCPTAGFARQAQKQRMIEPFVEAQRREGCISYGLSSYGYDARVADDFKIFTNVDNAIVDPKDFAHNSFVDRKTDVCIIPPNSFALARHGRIFPCAPRRHGHLPRQIDLCALRDHRERDAAGARLGRPCDAGILQHHAAAGQGLCQRGRVPVPVPAGQRAVRSELRRPRRQIYGAEGRDACRSCERIAAREANPAICLRRIASRLRSQ